MKDQIMTLLELTGGAGSRPSLPSSDKKWIWKVTTSGHHDQEAFTAPIDRLFGLYLPVAARNRAQAGGLSRGARPPCAAALPDRLPRLCAFSPASGGGISSEPPLFQDWKRVGEKVDPLHYKMEVK